MRAPTVQWQHTLCAVLDRGLIVHDDLLRALAEIKLKRKCAEVECPQTLHEIHGLANLTAGRPVALATTPLGGNGRVRACVRASMRVRVWTPVRACAGTDTSLVDVESNGDGRAARVAGSAIEAD